MTMGTGLSIRTEMPTSSSGSRENFSVFSGIEVLDEAVLGLEDLGVGDLDALLAAGRDGIDPGPEEVAADVLEEPRVLIRRTMSS